MKKNILYCLFFLLLLPLITSMRFPLMGPDKVSFYFVSIAIALIVSGVIISVIGSIEFIINESHYKWVEKKQSNYKYVSLINCLILLCFIVFFFISNVCFMLADSFETKVDSVKYTSYFAVINHFFLIVYLSAFIFKIIKSSEISVRKFILYSFVTLVPFIYYITTYFEQMG